MLDIQNRTIVAGAWKFLDAEKDKKWGVTAGELVDTAHAMIEAGIAQGHFVHMFVRNTGHDEIGLCFMYEPTADELEARERGEDIKMPYIDFFRRRHGVGYKGYDIGSVTEVVNLSD